MSTRTGNSRLLPFSPIALAGAIIFLTTESASACAVCFGGADAPMTQSVNQGIILLLSVVAAVQVFFVAVFLSIRQRARKLEQRKSRFHVPQGGSN